MTFTDYYAQQSCTAGRAAFIGGTNPLRSGMTKVGVPGAPQGWQKSDVTMATVLKSQGYATGQFGKNHQGDRDEHLPTMHGFDEFLGNLDHLNAEEEPENEDYPADPAFRKRFGPRGVLKVTADGKGGSDDRRYRAAHEEADGDHRRRDRGGDQGLHRAPGASRASRSLRGGTGRACTSARTSERSIGTRATTSTPTACSSTRCECRRTAELLDDLGIANDTIVFYSTDNGPHFNTWPDAGRTPFRSEKNSNWEGAYRVPAFIRWPRLFPAGVTLNGIVSHQDWLPTFADARPARPTSRSSC